MGAGRGSRTRTGWTIRRSRRPRNRSGGPRLSGSSAALITVIFCLLGYVTHRTLHLAMQQHPHANSPLPGNTGRSSAVCNLGGRVLSDAPCMAGPTATPRAFIGSAHVPVRRSHRVCNIITRQGGAEEGITQTCSQLLQPCTTPTHTLANRHQCPSPQSTMGSSTDVGCAPALACADAPSPGAAASAEACAAASVSIASGFASALASAFFSCNDGMVHTGWV